MTPLLGTLADRRPAVLAFVDLVQDIDVMLPVLEAIRARDELRLKIVVSRWLAKESPRTGELLAERGFRFGYVRRRQVVESLAPSLRGMSAVIAASESAHPAHAAAHALARRAGAAGLKTYALQHGFESVGLYGLEASAATFASEVVFCWFPEAATPRELADATRRKLAHVGRPAPAGVRADALERFDVGVFENLHWDRYGETDRRRFVEGLKAAAGAWPQLSFLLRPHPAGGWADRIGHELAPFTNIRPARAQEARSRQESGADILEGLRRVITTPSTVALDAAQAGLPVAMATDGGAAYDPLPILRSPQDWIAFAGGKAFDVSHLDQFLARVLVAGDGAPRVAARLSRDLMHPGPRRHG
jgi:hypothetical protein